MKTMQAGLSNSGTSMAYPVRTVTNNEAVKSCGQKAHYLLR